jgi:hypothetical protein
MTDYQPSSFNFYSGQYANPTDVPVSNQQFSNGRWDVKNPTKPFDFGTQAAQSSDFRQRFGDFISGMETPEATRARFENRYGYDELSNQQQQSSEMLGRLGAQISAAPEQIKERTAGTMTTQAQLSGITNKEVGDLMKVYGAVGAVNQQQTENLAKIEQNMNNAAQLEMAQQQKRMTPWLQEYQDINIQQARQFTGWTFASQLELDRLVNNRNAGQTWSNAEAERANRLALQEEAFNQSLQKLEKENEYAIDLWDIRNAA